MPAGGSRLIFLYAGRIVNGCSWKVAGWGGELARAERLPVGSPHISCGDTTGRRLSAVLLVVRHFFVGASKLFGLLVRYIR